MKFQFKIPWVVLCLVAVGLQSAKAQEIHIRDSIRLYNQKRIRINYIGSLTLGAWGVGNIVYGGAGISGHQGPDQCAYQVNTAFGVLNTGISIARYIGVAGQLAHMDAYRPTVGYYQTDRNYSIGVTIADLAITCGGLYALSHSQAGSMDVLRNPAAARSICLQGLVRLIIDEGFWIAHFSNNMRWYDIMADFQFTGNSIGFRYQFGGRRQQGG